MNELYKHVNDLGVAAYIMMHGFKPVNRVGNATYFEVTNEEFKEFEGLQWNYLTSDFHRFDSCLMALKKMNSKVMVKD